ncbi:MAG: hypothetical protein V3S89_04685 [Desulfobacterales bacterium]
MKDSHHKTWIPDSDRPVGRRIHVTGNSCSGKSTLGAQLANRLSVPFVELDALNWEPDWVGLNDTDPTELELRIKNATAGEGWVVAGSYMNFSQRIFWPRLETVIWLDLPMGICIWRMLHRSWVRWRSKELLWGTNYETFWPQLMVWNKKDSLLWWIVTQYRRKRRSMLAFIAESRWQHIHFIQLRSSSEIDAFSHAMALSQSVLSGPVGE